MPTTDAANSQARAGRNVNLLYGLGFTWSVILISAVSIPFANSRGVSTEEFLFVQSVFFLALAALEVPAGILADACDRRTVLVLASGIRGLGGTYLVFADSTFDFLIAFLLIAAGNSLFSGTDVAMLYEQNEQRAGRAVGGSELLGRRYLYTQTGLGLSMVCGALVADWSLEAAILLNCLAAWVPLAVALQLVAPRRSVGWREAIGTGFRLTRLQNLPGGWLGMLLVAICLYSAAPMGAFYALQALWGNHDLPLAAYGLIGAVYSVLGGLSGRVAGRLWRTGLGRCAYLLIAAAPVVGFGAGAVGHVAFVVACGALLEICRGFTQAVLVSQFNDELRHEVRATANSLVSLGTRLTAGILTGAMAVLASSLPLGAVMGTMAAAYLIPSGVLLVVWRRGRSHAAPAPGLNP